MILLHQILILQGVFPMVKNILLANHSIVINLSTFNIDIILFICSGIWTSVLVNRPKMAFIKSFFSLNIESCLGHITHLVVRMLPVTQSYPTLCNPMDCSMPGFPVHHQLLKLAQTHVHWVGDAIQPSHPLLSPSPPAFSLSQHQDLF